MARTYSYSSYSTADGSGIVRVIINGFSLF